MSLRTRYASWSSGRLRVMVAVYSRPALRLLFADERAAMELELLDRDLPGIAMEEGGHLVAPAWGLQ